MQADWKVEIEEVLRGLRQKEKVCCVRQYPFVGGKYCVIMSQWYLWAQNRN